MRVHALLGTALWAAFVNANPHVHIRQLNSSSLSWSLSSKSLSGQSSTTLPPTSPTSTTTSSTVSSGSSASSLSAASASAVTITSTSSSSSIVTTNASSPAPTVCTGCVLEAFTPTTITYDTKNERTIWKSLVVTETVIYSFTTYLDTTVTESTTISVSSIVLVTGKANKTTAISYTTPMFTWKPESDITITFEAGPTYVAYTNIYGGLEFENTMPTKTADGNVFESIPPEPDCGAFPKDLSLGPTGAEDYQYYIQTFADGAPSRNPDAPVSLPPALIEHLKANGKVTKIFSGSDIATCTTAPINAPSFSETPALPFPTSALAPPPPPPLHTPAESTYISKTQVPTEVHTSMNVCLRCTKQGPVPPGPSENSHPDPPHIQNPDNNGPSQKPDNHHGPGPQNTHNPNQDQHITIGGQVVPVHPAQPSQPGQPNNPNQPQKPGSPANPNNPNNYPQNHPNPHNNNQQNPGVVIGSETLTPGQTTTMNGVQVVVPSQGGGSDIIVGGSTIAVNPAPTGPPVLTVGDGKITANPQGQFVVGTQTLTPGGPAITVDGSTLSLGPSGTIAVVNGVTQTLANAPFATGPAVLTVGDQTVSATVIGGSTQFVLGAGQTLTPGGVLTVDGTTFSMPKDGSGSEVVVNGVTSTLNAAGQPIITLDNEAITASVQGGTTAFIFGPDKTLTPGGVLTISGTTLSMPASASGSVVVINGVTSTLGQGPVTAAAALTIDGKTYSATVRDGTTEYVLGPGTTLKPGEAVTISGTTYSLDPKGTALIINGKTSSIPKTPASNSATTTNSASSSEASFTTSERAPGNFIASGIGVSDKPGSGVVSRGGLDKWAEGLVIGVAGWLVMLL